MPRIDAERMIRAARVARRLGERGRHGSVLSAIAGESLADAQFVGTASANPGDGRMHLVLSFAQSEVRNFTAGHAEAPAQLANVGLASLWRKSRISTWTSAALKRWASSS